MKLNFLDDSPNGESQVEMDFVKIPAGGGCESFWYGVTPVTEAQWAGVMGGPGKGSNRPKTEVSLSDAQEFCAKLGNGARLPTEMEQCWALGREPQDLENYAVFEREEVVEVKTKLPNEYGLYDVRGLVWEWAETGKELKSMRGGSWFGSQLGARAVFRYGSHPAFRSGNAGFRLVVLRLPQ